MFADATTQDVEGLGTQLCEALETWFRDQGCGSIDLQCFYRNEGARRLYERRGYVPTVVRMNKALGTA